MSKCPPGCECNTPAEYLPPCSCGCGAGEPEPRIVKDPPAWTPLLFTCTRCPESFPFMADLRAHLRGHLTVNAKAALDSAWEPATVEDTSIPCPHCHVPAGTPCEGYCPAKGGA